MLTFPSFRSDLNDALQAAATISAGATAPTTPYAYQLWFDTSTNTYKARNAGNSAWISLFGTDLTNDGITFGDSDKAIFGNSSDLQIYHDGTNSFVINTVGELIIRNTSDDKDIFLQTDNGSGSAVSYVQCDGSTGEVKLNHYGSTKITTSATGVDVTGGLNTTGNVLVGTTDTTVYDNNANSSADNGINIRNDGKLDAARYSGIVLGLNRTGTDGTIAEFRKSGSVVGSIGITGGDLYIASSDTGHEGLRFGNGAIIPVDSAGASTDAASNIGGATSRFNNLYLSGGVYLGGTGSANHLDDYEEGTWTPEVRTSGGDVLSATTLSGRFTKIGRLVHITGDLVNIDTTGGTSTHPVRAYDLPFTVDEDLTFGSCISSVVTLQNGRTQLTVRANTSDFIEFFTNGSAQGYTPVDVGDLSSGVSDLNFSITYYTNQ